MAFSELELKRIEKEVGGLVLFLALR